MILTDAPLKQTASATSHNLHIMKAKHVVKENAASPGTQDWKNKLLPGSNNNNDFKTQIKTITAHFPSCILGQPCMWANSLKSHNKLVAKSTIIIPILQMEKLSQ